MTDTAISILAGSAALSIVAISIVVLALALRDASVQLADARVNDATKAGAIAIRDAEIATLRNSLDTETHRADALDDDLAKADEHPDPVGARDRVLASWRAARAGAPVAAGGAPGPVLAPTPAGST